MATYTTTMTPRRRVARHFPLVSDRSASHIASGPSLLPDFSQLVDVSLNDMPTSETTEQRSATRPSTPSTVTRSENPAAVLRALLSRLPPSSPPPAQRRSPSSHDISERESDYDMSDASHATPSVAQESLKDLFSKARQDPQDPSEISHKSRPRRNSLNSSEVDASLSNDRVETDRKGKRRSLSDDGVDQANYSVQNRLSSRSRGMSQPVTMEFLRERFDNSQSSPAGRRSSSSNHDSSNETATILLNVSPSPPPSPPIATSTPQHSLRMSVNGDFRSNLLEENTEMRHAFEGLESYGDSSLGPQVPSPPVMRTKHKPSIDKSLQIAGTPRRQSYRSPSQSGLWSAKAASKNRGMAEAVALSEQELDCDSRTPRLVSSRSVDSELLSPVKSLQDEDPPSRAHSLLPTSHANRFDRSPPPRSSQSRHPELRPRSLSPSALVLSDEIAQEAWRERERDETSPQEWYNPSPSTSQLSRSADGDSEKIDTATAFQSKGGTYRSSKRTSTSSVGSVVLESRVSRPSVPSTSASGRSLFLQHSGDADRYDDPSPSHLERSPSPLPSFSKKRSASPSPSTTRRKQKTSIPVSSARTHADSSFPSDEKENHPKHRSPSSQKKSNESSMELTSIYHHPQNSKESFSRLSLEHVENFEQANLNMKDLSRNGEVDDLPSTGGGHSPLRGEGLEISQSRLSLRDDSWASPVISSTPRPSVQENSPVRNTFRDITESPSTPRRRNRSQNSRAEFRTPSPLQSLPDLPSSSSDDESKHNSEANPTSSLPSGANGHQALQGTRTPRPPGGWYATPRPSKDVRMETSEGVMKPVPISKDDSGLGSYRPATYANDSGTPAVIGKTPKPPGGWVPTPGPVPSARLQESDMAEQSGGFLTPVPSSKEPSFEFKTPGIPGRWLVTPANKKSMLKVRFDSDAAKSKIQVQSGGNVVSSPENGHVLPQPPTVLASRPDSSNSALSSSPQNFSKSKGSGIRVLDAFGREEGSSELKHDRLNRSALRVVDAMGREVEDALGKSADSLQLEELESRKPSRGELLSHIRRGLDDLAGELNDVESRDERSVTKARIEELNAVSREARKTRERLQRLNLPRERTDLHPSFNYTLRDRWCFYAMMALVQLLLSMFVYRLAMRHARTYLLNTYYDPFIPDVHLYLFDSNSSGHLKDSDFSNTWYLLIIRSLWGKLWNGISRFTRDILAYFWTSWDSDSVSRNSFWLPT